MAQFGVGILAGGKSTRMGRDKALLPFGGTAMLAYLARELAGGELLISAAEPGMYEHFGFPVVYDEHRDIGPIEGMRRLLMEAESEYLFLCAADMPLLRRELADFLALFLSSDCDCCVATSAGRVQPLCGIYSKNVLGAVEEQIASERYKLSGVLERVRAKYVPLELSRFDARAVENVNTPREYARLFAPRVFCVCGLKHSGKTTLVCRLIEAFRADGYMVATIKHDGHDCFADMPGTDTARCAAAGAACAAVYSDTRFALHVGVKSEPEALIETVCRLTGTPDVLIVEGMKASRYPKLEVMRGDGSAKSVCTFAPPLLLATEEPPADGLPIPAFRRDDIAGIYALLKRELGLEDEA